MLLVFAVVLLVHALLEFLLGLAEGARQRRQLGAAEEQEHDEQDDDQLGSAEAHKGTFRRVAANQVTNGTPQLRSAAASISTSSSDPTWNGTAPAPTMMVSTPAAAQSSRWARISSTVPTSRPAR